MSNDTQIRKSYGPPTVIEYGSVEDLVLGVADVSDAGTPSSIREAVAAATLHTASTITITTTTTLTPNSTVGRSTVI